MKQATIMDSLAANQQTNFIIRNYRLGKVMRRNEAETWMWRIQVRYRVEPSHLKSYVVLGSPTVGFLSPNGLLAIMCLGFNRKFIK